MSVHLLDHDLVDLTGTFTSNDQAGANLPQLNPVGDIENTVENTETGVGEIINRGIPSDTEGGCNLAGRGRLEMLAADSCINYCTDVLRGNIALLKRLFSGSNSTVLNRCIRFPPASFADTGQGLKLPRRNMQSFVGRLQAAFQLGRGDHDRGQLVTDRFNVNTGISHQLTRNLQSFLSLNQQIIGVGL